MSIPKHAIDNNANRFGRIAGNSPLLAPHIRPMTDPPQQLYYRGDISLLRGHRRLAIVGSRKITPYGRQITARLAGDLSRQGIVVISGLALGVDAEAHRAAVEAHQPTIAILPSCLERVYPRSHQRLAEQIVECGGLLLSEYTKNPQPHKYQFIARNRLIAALSEAVLIPEAAHDSGSLHTAEFALDLGKPVLAVPGNIDRPSSAGTNKLIQTGAGVVLESTDVLEALGIGPIDTRRRMPAGSSSEETTILQLLQAGPLAGTTLLKQSQLTASLFNQTLTMLEVAGKIQSLEAGIWTIV